MCQIASFYAGAMSEARNIELRPGRRPARRARPRHHQPERPGGDGAPHRRSAASAGTRSSPTRRSSSPGCPARTIRDLIDGAAYLITNDYEKELLESKTGLSDAEVLDRVGVRVTTLGKDGVAITGRDIDPIHVPVAQEVAGATTRPGSATASGPASSRPAPGACRWSARAQVGSLLATLVLETVGHPGVRGALRRVRQAAGRVLRRRLRRRAYAPFLPASRLIARERLRALRPASGQLG